MGYVLAVAFKWTPSMEGYLRTMSVPVWTTLIFYLGKTVIFEGVNNSVWAILVFLVEVKITGEHTSHQFTCINCVL